MDFFGQSLDFAVNLTTTIAATFVLSIKGNTVVKKFNAKEYTTAPLQISKSRLIDATAEDLWKIISDHEHMTTWMPMIKHVSLVEADQSGKWEEGCERHCQFGPDLLKEKIVYWNAPIGYAYAISDMHLVRDHVAYIQLEEQQGKTRVTWSQYFIPNGNVIKNFMAKSIMMPTVMSRALKNLETKIKTSHV